MDFMTENIQNHVRFSNKSIQLSMISIIERNKRKGY